MSDNTTAPLLAEIASLRAALKRLASSEAFDVGQVLDGPLAPELTKRMEFAEKALANAGTAPASPGANAIAAIIRAHVKVDATGLSPSVASTFIVGFETAAQAVLEAVGAPAPGTNPNVPPSEVLAMRLAKAREFVVESDDSNTRVMIQYRGDDRWVVSNGTAVFNSFDEWEWEPMPSNRDAEFIARTRMTLDEAFVRAEAALNWTPPGC